MRADTKRRQHGHWGKKPSEVDQELTDALRESTESLLGLARARLASGDSKGGIEAYSKLLANWKHADADLPALAEAKGVVQGLSTR